MQLAKNWDFEGCDTQYLTHNFHPFAARFIPQIPSRIIQTYSAMGDRVLDPFMGCGTTLVECKLSGRDGVGVDINPLFALITRAKTTPLSEDALRRMSLWNTKLMEHVSVRSSLKLEDFLKEERKIPPHWKNIDHWFSKTAQNELATLVRAIDTFAYNPHEKDFLLTCLSSIIVRVSYQDSETRYAQKKRSIKRFYVFNVFRQKLKDMIERMRSFSRVCSDSSIETFSCDSRKLQFLRDESFDLVITSPPYMNAYDYHKYHRQRMLWLNIEPTPIRTAEIGGHDIYTRPGADPQTYFHAMKLCMSEMYRVLRSGKHCFIVIGDSIVGGRTIHSQDRFAELGKNIGFMNIDLLRRKVDSSRKSFGCGARLQREYIVSMKKP